MNDVRLIVEGPDDKHVVQHLLNKHGIEDVDCREKNGVEELLKQVRLQIEVATDWRKLGIIIDADMDAQSRWFSIVGILSRNDYRNIPATPQTNGTILANGEGRRVGIWIMPDNSLSGAIEDFLVHLIPPTDTLWPRAHAAVDTIPDDQRLFKATYISKAKIHTWLAWQEEPGARMGSAINKCYFDHTAGHARIFIQWIQQLLSQ